MKQSHLLIFLALGITAAIACTKGGNPEGVNGAVYTVTGNASSKQLVPAIDSISTGTFNGRYDEQARIFTYTIGWDSLWAISKKDTITAIQFFGPAAVAANGPLIKAVPTTSLNLRGSITLGSAGYAQFSDEQWQLLMDGKVYYVITTRRFPNGIIRGQLEAKKQ